MTKQKTDFFIHKIFKIFILAFVILIFDAFLLSAQTSFSIKTEKLPLIEKLDSLNPLFDQYCQDVEESYKKLAKNEKHIPQVFYKYKATKEDTLFTLAARLSIPYETLASVNSIPSPDTSLSGKTIILPAVAGLFVAQTPSSTCETLLKKRYAGRLAETDEYKTDVGAFYFFQNEKLTPTERAFFVDSSMKPPLAQSVMTSSFGYRVSPISGTWKFHPGIDLAAPEGSSVYACKHGKVSAVSYNSTYGNYIILVHDGGMTSVYAHLSKTLVKKGDIVSGGALIGLVGTTGASTGPHLHFEVRVNGSPTNPGALIHVSK